MGTLGRQLRATGARLGVLVVQAGRVAYGHIQTGFVLRLPGEKGEGRRDFPLLVRQLKQEVRRSLGGVPDSRRPAGVLVLPERDYYPPLTGVSHPLGEPRAPALGPGGHGNGSTPSLRWWVGVGWGEGTRISWAPPRPCARCLAEGPQPLIRDSRSLCSWVGVAGGQEGGPVRRACLTEVLIIRSLLVLGSPRHSPSEGWDCGRSPFPHGLHGRGGQPPRAWGSRVDVRVKAAGSGGSCRTQ